MTYLGVDAISTGDPDVLVNGIDYDGRICGVDEDVKDKPKVMFAEWMFDPRSSWYEGCRYVACVLGFTIINPSAQSGLICGQVRE